MKLTRALYALARALNDANAVRRGPRATGRRIIRRVAWRMAARFIGRTLR